jgi:hypothetical protein
VTHSLRLTALLSFLFALVLSACAPSGAEGAASTDDDTVEEGTIDSEALADTGWDTGWDGAPLPPATCSGSACDGQDPTAMGCTGLTTLANGTSGGVTWALRYSSICKTTFVRAWRHSTGGYMEARVMRETDLTTQQVLDTSATAGTKKDSGMLYCPAGSCSSLACVRDSTTGSYSCTDWK